MTKEGTLVEKTRSQEEFEAMLEADRRILLRAGIDGLSTVSAEMKDEMYRLALAEFALPDAARAERSALDEHLRNASVEEIVESFVRSRGGDASVAKVAKEELAKLLRKTQELLREAEGPDG